MTFSESNAPSPAPREKIEGRVGKQPNPPRPRRRLRGRPALLHHAGPMKVLVADKFEDAGLSGLKGLGCEVFYEPKLEGTALGERLAETGADVLVVRSTK